MKYRLADRERLSLEQSARWSCSDDPREGYFRLFNKNGMRTTFVKPIRQIENEAVWIVEADEPIDPYFKNVLVKESDGTA